MLRFKVLISMKKICSSRLSHLISELRKKKDRLRLKTIWINEQIITHEYRLSFQVIVL